MKKLLIVLLALPLIGFGQDNMLDKYNSLLVDQYKEENIVNLSNLTNIKINTLALPNNDIVLLPCVVNGILKYFVFDTGCDAGLNITEKMFSTMIEKEKIYYEDYLGDVESIMANGSKLFYT